MTHDILKFSTNWNNKLGCRYHTTFRLRNPEKYKIGTILKEYLKDQFLQEVEVVEEIAGIGFNWLPAVMCYQDAGYCKEEFVKMIRTMYKNKAMDLDSAAWSFYLLKII